MLIWFLAFLCFGLLGSGGQVQGGIKMAISLFGVLLGALLAVPVGPLLKPLLPFIGLGHPVWSWCVPPVIVFLAVVLFFTSIAQAVGHKVYVWYTYKAADDERLYWGRLNCRLGICVGILQGGVYLVLLGLLIYVMGYFFTQVKSEQEMPLSIRMVNSLSADLKGSGLEKIVNAINPVPQSYYDAADVVGLLYQNPDLRQRLADYPLFVTLSERADVKAALADKEFMAMAKGGTNSFIEIINQPVFKAFLNNPEMLALAQQVDPKDLLEFLRTAKSPKYAPEQILGTWQIDPILTLNAIRKKSNSSVTELRYLQGVMRALMQDVTFVAGANNQTLLKGSTKDAAQMMTILSFKLPPNVQPPPPPKKTTNTFKLLVSGTWKKDGDGYNVTFENLGEAPATAADSRLTVSVGGNPIVFFKLD